MTRVIDSDQHLVEYRGMWSEHIDPARRADALEMVDDDAGWTWMTWRGNRLGLVDIQAPGDTAAIGDRHQAAKHGEPCLQRWDDALPADHWNPTARRAALAGLGVDEAMLFPNFGLLWERKLQSDPGAQMANMAAWNRWAAIVAQEGQGALHPVAHLHLRDADWLERELRALSDAGVRAAMVAPALVDGRPLSHPDLDRAWSLFETHGVAPVFHVADQPRPFDDAWYVDADQGFPTLESVFLWTAAALSCTDLIVNGVFERHPELRLGIVELSAIWVPMYLLMLDGGVRFTSRLNGVAPGGLRLEPSEYFRRHVRVSSFSYELPARITRDLGGHDLLMACSDYPHSEGTATPLDDYARGPERFATTPQQAPRLFHDNAAWLLRHDA
jgi:predicted TIM-barrel fold metal-dependent hydrolase